MTESVVQQRNIHINGARTKVAAREDMGRIEFYGNLGKYPGYEGLKWRTWKFEDTDASKKDGALAEINPGKRTPLELVEADKIFSEVPLEGELVFLHLDNQNNISAYHFDSKRPKDNSFVFEVIKGEVFCLIALGQKPAEVLEYEEPGFTESDLKLIDAGTKEVYGRSIPDELWEMIEQLERGEIKNTIVPIQELNDLP
jgi:hypothetical protein